ncbi:MAG TPA: MurR/RpiR family transcriptional regulator [Aliidongia sp.]|uniref:MurR/RpiR family transcriptional regulator n=1 Tax=Aliidongia sp. TaxID=1914230 RepID=UPI002DDCFAED|nr:MurR/RpiR family transcriptional regulator [Aliidongia sp.]HEV2677409.1 MurR/RpiR family transcriptional regulator [Aliidongia sp.]
MVENLLEVMTERAAGLTKLEKRVAAYLTANPDAVLIETSAAIAERSGVSAMTVTRFFKKLGFENVAAAKKVTRRQVYGPSVSRIGSRFDEFQKGRASLDNDVQYQAAVASMRKVCEYRTKPIWQDITRLVAEADSVFVTGFQTMSYLATGLALRLGYVRPNVHELDGGDGVYAKVLTDPAPKRTLILIDVFRYGRNGPVLARAARDQGADVIVFCDEFCHWAAEITPHVVALPADSDFLFRSTLGIHFALSLLTLDVADRLGDAVKRQLDRLSDAQELFGQYMK